MILADHEAVAESIRQGKVDKATKVPMPSVPGIIAAAKAIPNSLKAETLVAYTYKLLNGFLRKGLCVVACAADGSTVEQSVQNTLTSKAKKKCTIHFKHPKGGNITLEISLFGKYFISKEACDIMKILVQGLHKLVLVYRDLPDIYPLLLWLLSTEICEHVFGLCRQIQPDFTVLDFYYMVPRLFIRLREAAFFKSASNGKERASGYNHLYHNVRGINLNALSTYPTDGEMQDAIQSAYKEAENLWHLLGFTPSDLDDAIHEHLPSIPAWFSSKPDSPSDQLNGDLMDSDYEDNIDDNKAEEEITSKSREVHKAIDHLESVKFGSFDKEDKVNNLTYAAVSVTVDESIEIQMLCEYDAKASQTKLREEALIIKDSMNKLWIPLIILPEEQSSSDEHDMPASTTSANTQPAPSSSSRAQILKELNLVIKSVEEKEKGVQTGLVVDQAKSGFRKLKFDPAYGTGRVTMHTPLVAHQDGNLSGNGFGYIFHKDSIVLAKGAKTGKHGRVNGVICSTAASNIVVQIFEHSRNGRTFTDIPQSHQQLQLKRFELISHLAFLNNLDKAPVVPHSGRGIGFLEVSEKDLEHFTFLKQQLQKVVQIQKLLVSRATKAGHESDNE
ncbi:hypothetical protein B0H34DRAFT_824720 [Crassisporium funariophilum]|nr:hypothetical protein B0H34DRAFT_824720 [Crassisporium funariophilum]